MTKFQPQEVMLLLFSKSPILRAVCLESFKIYTILIAQTHPKVGQLAAGPAGNNLWRRGQIHFGVCGRKWGMEERKGPRKSAPGHAEMKRTQMDGRESAGQNFAFPSWKFENLRLPIKFS